MLNRQFWIAGILVLLTIPVLTSCGGTEEGASGDQNNGQVTLNVVGLFPMTGPGGSLGNFLHNGVTLAKEKLEDQYKGRLVVNVKIVDTKNKPHEAVSGLQSAIARERPHAVISALSSVSSAVKPIVESEGVLTIATTTALSDLVQGSKHMVRVYPTAKNFAQPIAKYAGKHFTKVAVLYIHDDFGASVFEEFKRALQETQTKIVSSDAFELLQKDTRTLVGRILADKPEAIYVVGYGPAYVNVIRQTRELSPETKVLADISLPNPAVLKALGRAAEGIVFDGTDAELTIPKTSEAANFRKLYIDRFKSDPFMVAGFAYDSLMAIGNAAMLKGGLKALDKAQVISLSPLRGIMGEIQLDEAGESDLKLKLMMRSGGKTVLLEE